MGGAEDQKAFEARAAVGGAMSMAALNRLEVNSDCELIVAMLEAPEEGAAQDDLGAGLVRGVVVPAASALLQRLNERASRVASHATIVVTGHDERFLRTENGKLAWATWRELLRGIAQVLTAESSETGPRINVVEVGATRPADENATRELIAFLAGPDGGYVRGTYLRGGAT